jgi:hypothetical protein
VSRQILYFYEKFPLQFIYIYSHFFLLFWHFSFFVLIFKKYIWNLFQGIRGRVVGSKVIYYFSKTQLLVSSFLIDYPFSQCHEPRHWLDVKFLYTLYGFYSERQLYSFWFLLNRGAMILPLVKFVIRDWAQWFTSVILVIWEAEIERTVV